MPTWHADIPAMIWGIDFLSPKYLDSDSNASSSDTSDLDEMFQNKQHMRMRPAFNCKKKMISSTSY